jgi:hypothetical protein
MLKLRDSSFESGSTDTLLTSIECVVLCIPNTTLGNHDAPMAAKFVSAYPLQNLGAFHRFGFSHVNLLHAGCCKHTLFKRICQVEAEQIRIPLIQ